LNLLYHLTIGIEGGGKEVSRGCLTSIHAYLHGEVIQVV